VKTALFALVLISSPVLAQQGQAPQMPDLDTLFFQQFDSDKNGMVSKAEFLEPTEAQFDHMDTNKDGVLDQSEVKAFNEQMQQRMQQMQRQMQQQGMPRR
jgi:Ca2+-binding EF-hand superfamily protein